MESEELTFGDTSKESRTQMMSLARNGMKMMEEREDVSKTGCDVSI